MPDDLKYPNPTPKDFTVIIPEYKTETSYRAHLISDGSDEVYFEIGMYLTLQVKKAIELFQEYVSARIEQLQTGQVDRLTFADLPAYRLSIQWPGKERVILFIEKETVLYRIIHNPASSINKKILESFKFG